MAKDIDMTPTFESAVNMCIVALENGSEKGREMARSELRRYGRELDRLPQSAGSELDPSDAPVAD